MTRQTKQRLLVLAFVLWICYTITLSIVKMPENESIGRFHLDVVFHFTSYFVMAVLGASLIRGLVLLPGIAVAAGTEIGQHFLPYRTASWFDFGINVVGIVLGLLTWWLVRRTLIRRTKSGTANARE